jgi:hypothetical protein
MRLFEFTQTLAESDNPVTNAITRRILLQRTDLLSKYGPVAVTQAIDEVSDFVGDVDEIGSSDVSGWIKHVEQMLVNMGEQGVAEASGYDGSEPLDLSTNPSVNDVFKRALYIYDYEGYGNDMDYSEDDAIEQYVAQKFGQDVLDQLNKAKNQQYFGRADGKGPGGGGRTSNLGTSSAPGGNFRTTKAGVMNKQDAKMMKARVANRLGRHPAPNLPEAGYYNPLDQERREQDQMDYNKRAFKRAEMQHELGHEDDPDFERKQRQQAMDRDRGPWYIRIDGKIYRQGGQPKSFDWKKGANNYALAMVKNNPSLQGKVMLSKNSEDK